MKHRQYELHLRIAYTVKNGLRFLTRGEGPVFPQTGEVLGQSRLVEADAAIEEGQPLTSCESRFPSLRNRSSLRIYEYAWPKPSADAPRQRRISLDRQIT